VSVKWWPQRRIAGFLERYEGTGELQGYIMMTICGVSGWVWTGGEAHSVFY
jgi:hypothetical protein